MAGLSIEPFSDEHVDVAAELLAARHARHRHAEPLLPMDVDFRAAVDAEASAPGASGVVAFLGGEPVAYLVGRPLPYGDDGTWMLVGIAGHAVAGDPEIARDTYAAAAETWVEDGHRRHGVFVPSSDLPLVDAWFRLSFGASAVLAIRETSAEPPFETDVHVRASTPAELEDAARLSRHMTASMVPSPSFSTVAPETQDEAVEEWRDTWNEEQFTHFVAERGGAVVGHVLMYKRPADLRVPADSIDLAGASTEPEARGTGVGRALTAHVINWAYDVGYPTMVTDWRMTNLWASRFWPRRGFRPTFLRLYRSIP